MLYQTLGAPITCQIELTTGCDNDCLYCYNHWRHDKEVPGANMKRAMLDKVIDQLIEHNVFQVTFTGGEVLLRKSELFHGLERLISAGVSCTVNSNLTRITAADATTLHRIGLRGMLTSVCSHTPVTHDLISQRTGAFADTMKGIKCAQDAGLIVAASMVLVDLNVRDVIPTGIMLKQAGVTQMFATKASPPVNATNFARHMISNDDLIRVLDDLNVLRTQHRMEVGILECYPLCSYGQPERYPFVADRRCSAGTTTCTIGADGEVRACSHSERSYGNIEREGLVGAWMAMKDQRDGSLLPQTCRDCSVFAQCSGGCRVDAFCCSGKHDALDPYARPEAVKQIKVPKVMMEPVGTNEVLVVNPRLHVRREEFCVLCADHTTMGAPAPLTHDTYRLVEQLGQQRFTARDIVRLTDLPENESRKLCGMLKRDRVFCSADHEFVDGVHYSC